MDRRQLLIGAAGMGAAMAVSSPARALSSASNADQRVRDALDGLGALKTPSEKLARLRGLSMDGLSECAGLDLATVRQGLAVDEKLAVLWPDHAPGGPLYAVSPRGGAWRAVGSDKAPPDLARRIDRDTRRIEAQAEAGIILPRAFLDDLIAAQHKRVDGGADDAAVQALQRQIEALSALRSRVPDRAGVGQLPKGERWYALMVERQLGEPADIPAIHARLLEQWQALAMQSSTLLMKMGFTKGSVGERFLAMFRDPRWHYPDTSAGHDRAVADMNAVLDRSRARVAELIGPVPPYCLSVRARRMSPADEAAGRGGYRIIASPTEQGAYYVDLSDISRRPGWSLAAVTHHELLPGHMIQMPMEQAADPHPLRIQYASAFTEGWAVYAETLSEETGGFAGDVPGQLGYLHWALFRIGRGIADTGIHHAGWTREQALARLRETQGEPAFFASFESDVDRICLDPGIRAAEAMIALRLGDLRRRAMSGPKDMAGMRHFHQLLLKYGRKRLTTIEAELKTS